MNYPHTPVVRRRAQRLASHPYMRFKTDFRVSPSSISNQVPHAGRRTPVSSSSQRSISTDSPSGIPDTSISPGYMRFFGELEDASCFPHIDPFSSFARSETSTPPITRRLPLERIEESEHEDSVPTPAYMRTPGSNETSDALSLTAIQASSTASPTTARRSNTRYLGIIEEDELEDDDVNACPPISSSPGRSSDSGADFFPENEASSSPQTSDHNPDSPAEALIVKTAGEDFGSQLYHLLVVAASESARNRDSPEALQNRSLSVTPDYPASSAPPYTDVNISHSIHTRRNDFGPRSSSSSSSSSDSAGIAESCDCSACARSKSSSRTESVASTVHSYSGYAADVDASLISSPIQAPSSAYQIASTTESRSSQSTPTQRLTPDKRLLTRSNSFKTPVSRAEKRSYSSLHEDPTYATHKKSKMHSRAPSSSRSKPSSSSKSLSRVPASLRKSFSLRSAASSSHASHDKKELIPTVPNTPCPTTKPGRLIKAASQTSTVPFVVPIIAPPPEHIARLPLSREACAKIRIGNFVAREERLRAEDGLLEFDIGARTSTDAERSKWEDFIGVGTQWRVKVIEWILEVLPKRSTYYPPISSASRSLFGPSLKRPSVSFSSSDGHEEIDLLDQLRTSPETRFHAAYLFLRYFFLLMTNDVERKRIQGMQNSDTAAKNELPWDPAFPPEGWNLVVWDLCLACLAISVKAHRDVLEPLSPVFSWEFEALAPHDLTYEDLEIGHRDVLSGLRFRLGDTPQLLLDELWTALPSLQQVLSFRGGWNYAQKETWALLFDAVCVPDVLALPISLLTVAALVEALVATLVFQYEYDATLTSLTSNAARRRSATNTTESDKVQRKLVARAEQEIEGVVQDIQAAVGISDEHLKNARSWVCTT
ncbi:hypothetical protein B0H15DRAFT_847779 [Mycena belliarum]|uniref:Uncharacterized protein n=1 Tax=Mycena belliarum TaxID=1033014 RepID=A0AAD6XKG5_9AGAR|nr:hypothetical protein B0H15DRAFT_847779 [Mycena belliae]